MAKTCIKKVWIDPGCITCGACEFIAPEIFEVQHISTIKPNAPLQDHVHDICIAAQTCPVNVIQYEVEER